MIIVGIVSRTFILLVRDRQLIIRTYCHVVFVHSTGCPTTHHPDSPSFAIQGNESLFPIDSVVLQPEVYGGPGETLAKRGRDVSAKKVLEEFHDQ